MPIFCASALNDNDEALAFQRAVLAPPEGRERPQHHTSRLPCAAADARSPYTRSCSGVPLIIGVATSITITAR
jgi:hypothetical protein